jgi:hypothetical protein
MMNRTLSFLSAMLVTLASLAVLGWHLLLPPVKPLHAAPSLQARPTPRIVGGEVAPVGAYPWMTALVANNTSPVNGQFCGGSLIHRDWVLTAAHCVTNGVQVVSPGSVDVVVNIHDLSQNNGIRRDVQSIVVHPQWNPSLYDYDIALLELAQPIDGVTPVTLAQASDAPIFAPGAMTRVMGWGATAWQGSGSDILLQVDVPIVSQQACIDSYGASDITDRMICAGLAEGGKDSCQGDSGGPLVADDNSVWRQVGIVSWGQGCAFPDLYGVYARVAVLYDWVAQHVNLNNPTPTPTATPTASRTPTATPTVTGTPPTATPTLPPQAYLPQVMNDNTSTPTATSTPTRTTTPTPTTTPTQGPSVLVNPGFEQGPGVGWQEYSSNGWDLILNSDFPGSIAPHGGQWLAWLGGDDDEISYVRQSVTIPANASTLRFWMWIASEDDCGYDFGGVLVNNTTVDQFNLCNTADTNGWVQRSVDLGAYAGQNVALQIRVETDLSFNSNLFIDDVALSAAARAYPVVPRPSTAQITANKAAAGVARTAGEVPGEARLWAPTAVEK